MTAPTEHKMAQLYASGQKGAELAKVMEEYAESRLAEERDRIACELENNVEEVVSTETAADFDAALKAMKRYLSSLEPDMRAVYTTAHDKLEKVYKTIVSQQGGESEWMKDFIKELDDE